MVTEAQLRAYRNGLNRVYEKMRTQFDKDQEQAYRMSEKDRQAHHRLAVTCDNVRRSIRLLGGEDVL